MTPIPLSRAARLEITRRDALRLFAASIAAVEVGCLQRPGDEIRAAARQPEAAPGVPRWFATTMTLDGFGTGLLVETHGGRPIKIEGNPAHPASIGATTAQHQASIADLYDPYRLRSPQLATLPASWDRVRAALATAGAGELCIVLPLESSPTLGALLDRVREQHRGVRILHHAVIDHRRAYRGTMLAFGAALEQQLALDRADLVVSLDADLLARMPMSVRWAREFAVRHRQVEPGQRAGRLVIAEPMMTATGSLADDRLAIGAADIAAVTIAVASALSTRGIAGVSLPAATRQRALARIASLGATAWLERTAAALASHRGRAAIVVGDRQPPAVHALAHAITLALGNVGTTTTFTEPAVLAPLDDGDLSVVAAAARAGQLTGFIAIDSNPVHAHPELAEALRYVPLTAHATMHADETTGVCSFAIPLSHYLEGWGDARAWDGSGSPIQPVIQPLHATRSTLELVAMLAGIDQTDRELVRTQWQPRLASDASWREALSEGVIAGTSAPARTVQRIADTRLIAELAAALGADAGPFEIDIASSPAIGDGRFAANPWLQELPHPVTKQTWGNAAVMSPDSAGSLGVANGDVVRITVEHRTVDAPVIISPGHAPACITLELGYGRTLTGVPIADRLGVDALALLRSPERFSLRGAVTRTGARVELACTQQHMSDHDREVAPELALREYRANPEATAHLRGPLPTLLEPRRSGGPQWAMTIDTTICTGCSACVIACQAENNTPTVGPEGVRRNREMHWLRIDRYVSEHDDGPRIVNQPMACQHCEHAPCEYVCPTFATVHSPDGLNEMVYNRCVGTRFCSNNCPYKVRRFNWFGYDKPATLRALQHNPDVTVRGRGVMEKCTYCVQRIRGAEIQARMEDRAIRPGEVVTACQQACPTSAIQFGSLDHPEAEVTRWRSSPRSYAVLHELGTRPRTMYLAKIRVGEGDA
ncbi:MAG: 4Fe-4S dicluster domain-containing protein [Kofleriaceae bacterium]